MEPISTSLIRRQDFTKLLLLGTLLALGLNLLANFIYAKLGLGTPLTVLVSILLILLPLGYGISLVLSARSASREIDGRALFDRKTKRPIQIDRYSFSEDLLRIIVAVTKENPAFQEMLAEDLFPSSDSAKEPQTKEEPRDQGQHEDEEPGMEYLAIVQTSSEEQGIPMRSSPLLIEAIEFVLLRELSFHLSTYFSDREASGEALIELTREHIPNVVLKNRVLSLLTTPIEQRPIFRKAQIHKNPPKGTVHSIWSKDGVMFERFDLILPAGSTLDRPEEGVLVLTTKRGVVRIIIGCDGFTGNLPAAFESFYMGVDADTLVSLKVDIQIETQLRPSALLTARGWHYYRWMDSFGERIVEEAHLPAFLTRIGWERALTGLIVSRRAARKSTAANKSNQSNGPKSTAVEAPEPGVEVTPKQN
jgi:hypothetical protein